MITVQKKQNLLNGLKEVFPGKTVKGNGNADGTMNTMAMVVDSIDGDQLGNLHLLTAQNNLNIKLKRSGTGISIHFN